MLPKSTSSTWASENKAGGSSVGGSTGCKATTGGGGATSTGLSKLIREFQYFFVCSLDLKVLAGSLQLQN